MKEVIPTLWVRTGSVLHPWEFPGDSAHFWGRASVSTHNTLDQKKKPTTRFAQSHFWTALLHVSGRSTEQMMWTREAAPRLAHAGTAPCSSVSCIFMSQRRRPKTKTVSADAKLEQGTWLLQLVGVNSPKINQCPKLSLKTRCTLLNHQRLNLKGMETPKLRFRQNFSTSENHCPEVFGDLVLKRF